MMRHRCGTSDRASWERGTVWIIDIVLCGVLGSMARTLDATLDARATWRIGCQAWSPPPTIREASVSSPRWARARGRRASGCNLGVIWRLSRTAGRVPGHARVGVPAPRTNARAGGGPTAVIARRTLSTRLLRRAWRRRLGLHAARSDDGESGRGVHIARCGRGAREARVL